LHLNKLQLNYTLGEHLDNHQLLFAQSVSKFGIKYFKLSRSEEAGISEESINRLNHQL
jgi:hypothetical protein